MADSGDGFVSRWSRRKRARQDERPVEAEPAAPAPEDRSGAAELVESLPDIDTLTEESDFTVFLQEGVPEALRQRALRRLWRLNPVFANLDGLAEYDEDYTLATSALQGAVKTIYQVGKGMVAPEQTEEEATVGTGGPNLPDPAEKSLKSRDAAPPEPDVMAQEERPALEARGDETAPPASVPAGPEPAPVRATAPKKSAGARAVERRWGRSDT